MPAHVESGFKEFQAYLSGTRAPALVAQSLATVVAQDPAKVAGTVVEWAYDRPKADRFAAMLSARDKVFDIFFYRVVRFRRIFEFFDRFESAMVDAVHDEDRMPLAHYLDESPWREIRPLGRFLDPLEYALEKRRRVGPQSERFNDEIYRNATHELLVVDKRHTFDDERTASLVARYQSQLAGVFDDFVDLVKNPQHRREILLANTVDRHASYSAKSRFDVTNYISHLMEFVIALVNDEFFEHGLQVFSIVRQIHADFNLDVGSLHWQRFKSHYMTINKQKLGEYSTDPARAVLLRSFLPVFEVWNQPRLAETILLEEERRARKLAISLLAAYGSEAYGTVVDQLRACGPDTPWYYVRNLAYLLGRIVTGNERLKHQAVQRLSPYLSPASMRQVNLQVVAALGFIGSDEAVAALAYRLEEFAKRRADSDAAEIVNKIVWTLFGIGTPAAVEVAAEFCIARGLVARHREEFARANLPDRVRASVIARIHQETRKIRFTGALLGKTSTVRDLVAALGHAGFPDVVEVCREVAAAKGAAAAEASRVLATPAPPPMLAHDRVLHGCLARRDVTQALCHALDAGLTGRLDVITRDGGSSRVVVSQGRIVAAEVFETTIDGERAVFWTCLLDPWDIQALMFLPPVRSAGVGTVERPTEELLRDVVFQRAEVRQISDGLISPESRFKRRDVHPIYTDFSRLPNAKQYEAVWKALGVETDLSTIQSATGLSRHDIFRILLHFGRRNMLDVDAGPRDTGVARVADAIATIEVYVQRIERRPLQFRLYHTAADGCGLLERYATDEAIQASARALQSYFAEAYAAHRAFSQDDVDVCKRTLSLLARFHRGENATDRQELVDYVSFAFGLAPVASPEPVGTAPSTVEQLENILYCNDAFDPGGADRDEHGVELLCNAVAHHLQASGVSVESLAEGEEPTQTEASILLETFSDVAASYSKPIKDFARELRRARDSGHAVSSVWLRVVEPSVRLLSRVASTMRLRQVEGAIGSLERALEDVPDGARDVPPLVRELVMAKVARLAELAPLAFAIDLDPDQLRVMRSEVLATLDLRQVDGVTEEVLDLLSVAGMRTFDSYLDSLPEDISVTASIDAALAENIFMKFYQYQDLYRYGGDPVVHPKYVSMFEIGLTTVKEFCVELERLKRDEYSGKEVDGECRARLLADRQRALASLLALLAVRGQYDCIEAIQLGAYEERVAILDEYFAVLMSASPPPGVEHGANRADAA